MNSITTFDIVILGITLVLGLKGLFRGLVKELFGIIAIIGAIFVASRVSTDIGNLIAPALGLSGDRTIGLVGFIVALIGFWIVIYLLGSLISKMLSASGLGFFDRILGFIFGAAKIFMIFSVIAYALYQVNSFKDAISNNTKGSIVMPYLQACGSKILKLDIASYANKIGDGVDSVIDVAKGNTEENSSLKEDIKNGINSAKDTISNGVENAKNSIKDSIEKSATDTINSAKEKLKDIENK